MHLIKKFLKLYNGNIGQRLDQVTKINITNEGEMAIVGLQTQYPEKDTSSM